jgi:hypothetical protein
VTIKTGPNTGWNVASGTVKHGMFVGGKELTGFVETSGIQSKPEIKHPPGN